MTTPDEYADGFMVDLKIADGDDARQQQTEHRILGVSDIGHCRSYAARFLSGEPFTDTPEGSQSRAGKWFHAGVLPAIQSQRPGSLIERELTVTLSNGFEVLGHADLIEPDEPSVTDVKTVDEDLAAIRRTGASEQQRSQRNLYAAGAIQAGIVPQDGLTVRNIWLDRSGTPTPPHVEQSDYDPTYLDSGARFIDEVMYAVDQGHEAPKDRDTYRCRAFCPFFTSCRGGTYVPQETVQANDLSIAASLDIEGADMVKEGNALRKAAKQILSRLEGERVVIEGDAGRFTYKSTWVNPSEIKPGMRGGYYRTEVKAS